MTYGLLGKITAQPGQRNELLDCLLHAAKLLERNPACIHYVVGTSDEPDAVWASEAWTDKAHMTPPSKPTTSARSSRRRDR